jgi:hypothetical protein
MTADSYGSILGLIEQATGNNNNNWGTIFNNSFTSPVERAIAGVNTITATSGTVDLSTTVPPAGLRLDIDHIQILNGALTGDVTVKVTNVSKRWRFENKTTGAFNVFVQVPGGVSGSVPGIGGLVQIPQGKSVDVACDGAGTLYRGDRHEIGNFIHHAGTTAPAGSLIANGASYLRAEFPDLYLAHGTTWGSVDGTHFTLPLLTDTNRYLRAGGGSGPAVGTYQSNQFASHTHTGSVSVSVSGATDTQGSHSHSAPVSDPSHLHGVTIPSNSGNTGGGGAFGNNPTSSTTAYAGTGVAVSIGAAGAHAHNVSASGSGSFTTAASGSGTETRPESAAVLICIRY